MRIDNDGAFLAYVSTVEDNDDRLCLDLQQFEVLIAAGGGSSTNGVPDRIFSKGVIKIHEKRSICHHKVNGQVQTENYIDDTVKIAESAQYDVNFTSLKGEVTILETDEPVFCGGKKAKFKLSKE